MQHPNNPLVYYFNKNFISKGKFLGIPKRNLIEAAFWLIVSLGLINLIPFVRSVRIVINLAVGAMVGYFNIRGIYGRSVSEVLIDELKYRKNQRRLHLRSVEYVKSKKSNRSNNYQDESVLESLIRQGKEGLDLFLESNGKGRSR